MEKWIRIINERGNAGILASENDDQKQIVEKACAIEWTTAANAMWSLDLGAVSTNEDDPPDCLVQYKGRQIGVEVTELVDGTFFGKRKSERKEGRDYNAYHGSGFLATQWGFDKFRDYLLDAISKKTRNYAGRALKVDILLIVTAESWLTPESVEQWLDQINLASSAVFQAIYLLMDYDPSYSKEHQPVFKIFGGL